MNRDECCSSFCATSQAAIESARDGTVAELGAQQLLNLSSRWQRCTPRDDLDFRMRLLEHDARPHTFVGATTFGAFSPFAEAAVVSTRLLPAASKWWCATCGGPDGVLVSCESCPLAFHESCFRAIGVDVGFGNASWLCHACKTMHDRDAYRDAQGEIPAASIAEAFRRLRSKARGANPIDYQLHPALYVAYCDEYGTDWLRCFDCEEIREVPAGHGVVTVPLLFRCSDSRWLETSFRGCGVAGEAERFKRKQVERHLLLRSRRKSHLLAAMGEDDRERLGWPRLDYADGRTAGAGSETNDFSPVTDSDIAATGHARRR
jgi:hypothetical protein